eukprot:1081142-Karenia_brevis.AAC.1
MELPKDGATLKACRPKGDGAPPDEWWAKVATLKRMSGWRKAATKVGIDDAIVEKLQEKDQ